MLIYSPNSLAYNPVLIERARELRKRMTPQERRLWYGFLSKHSLRFLKQRVIDNYIVDFYCPAARLFIEVDGSHHYTDEGMKYDHIRTEILTTYGLEVIRFSNEDVDRRFKSVCDLIEELVKTCRLSDFNQITEVLE